MASAVGGERMTGQNVRTANVMAVSAIANIMKSSLGPMGLDKMLVDDIGDVTISNDGATILQRLEVQHPAAKLLVDLSDLQDKEVGDGTTSVVLIAAELLRRANELVKADIHPTPVIAGYKLAMKECVRYIEQNLGAKVDLLGRQCLLNVAATTLSSKYIGVEEEHFANLVLDAIQTVKLVTERGDVKYPVKAVNVLKSQGKSTKESFLVNGYALKSGRSAQGMPSSVANAKIALLDFNLRQHRMQLGISIQVEDPQVLEKIRQKEKDVTGEVIQRILASGANVILTSQGIDDMALKYFVDAKAIAVRRVDRKDLIRIAKLTGGTVALTLSSMDGEEKFEPSMLGNCEEVYEQRLGDWDYLFFKGTKCSKATTIILRGANDFMLDEVERSIHDALCAVSRALESNEVIAGGGAVETALSVYLESFARTLGSREQLAIAEFAEALLVIPKTLAANAAQDSTDLLAKLRSYHYTAQTDPSSKSKEYKWYGLDLVNGKVRDNLAAGVLEPISSKVKSIRFATEAAVTVLRIDELVKIQAEPEQRGEEE